jgi:hypothetical protein
MSAIKELDNANPTVLSASELPTRRQRKDRNAAAKVEGIRAILMANPSDTLDPFYMSEFSDTDSDGSTIQPIDEQEIYGKFKSRVLSYSIVEQQLSCVCKGLEGLPVELVSSSVF